MTAREYDRAKLQSGDVIEGPAIIREELSTTQVCPGQRATVGRYGEIVIERALTMTATDLLYEQPSKLIRDLSDAEFEERYDCERFTASRARQPLPLHRPAHVHRAC